MIDYDDCPEGATVSHSGLHLVTLTPVPPPPLNDIPWVRDAVMAHQHRGRSVRVVVTYEQLGVALAWAKEHGYELRKETSDESA